MPFVLKAPQSALNNDSIGQSWTNETIEENLQLCKNQSITPFFHKHLAKAGLILEAGCGLGRWVYFLNDSGYKTVGLEISQSAINGILHSSRKAPFCRGDVLKLPYKDASLDAVVSLGVVEHFPQGPGDALIEMSRVLKNDGRLLLSIPLANIFRRCVTHPLFALKRALKYKSEQNMNFIEYRYTDTEMRRNIAKAGFMVTDFVWDELRAPMNIGLYTDFGFLQHRTKKWHLNALGAFLNALFFRISPSIHAGGICYCCTKQNIS